ncbi:TPA: hypothetical protein ACQVKY_001105 [Serratia marcescens]|uniref:Uncharacterized protein n=1 Tax=Serratia nevei TaxID=2703794 RepID=A0ABT7G5P6_9GAMM|nr:hypothetical protein [Serratia nevei]HAU4290917.1 hypothetical protein [Serratia marcescens]MDK5169085.1 hypothetical protein [Serratia nevei]MDK5298579.1 hypothetical protein [Serratia nevei]MEC5887169.1 hypothetical protein [Serratia nevei]HAU4299283.1 hypothetical protein [Serratia marcescens]
MKINNPRIKDILLWNTALIAGGFIGGPTIYVYTMMAVFFAYTLFAFTREFQGGKHPIINCLVFSAFGIVNLMLFDRAGFGLWMTSILYLYGLFFIMLPLARAAKAKFQANHSFTTKGENHE